MVITRNSLSKSSTLQLLIGKEQLKAWLDDSTRTTPENIKITPQNCLSLAAPVQPYSVHGDKNHQQDAHQSRTLKCLVSQLDEKELTALLKLSGKQSKGNSFDEVLEMLQGEDSVIKELYSVGLFPSLPNDVPIGKVATGGSPLTVALTGLEGCEKSEVEASYGMSEITFPNSLENINQWTGSKSSANDGLKLKSMYDEYIIDLIDVTGSKKCRGENKKKLHHGLLLQCDGEAEQNSGSMKRSRTQ